MTVRIGSSIVVILYFTGAWGWIIVTHRLSTNMAKDSVPMNRQKQPLFLGYDDHSMMKSPYMSIRRLFPIMRLFNFHVLKGNFTTIAGTIARLLANFDCQ